MKTENANKENFNPNQSPEQNAEEFEPASIELQSAFDFLVSTNPRAHRYQSKNIYGSGPTTNPVIHQDFLPQVASVLVEDYLHSLNKNRFMTAQQAITKTSELPHLSVLEKNSGMLIHV